MIVIEVWRDSQVARFALDAADGAIEELQRLIDRELVGDPLTFELVEMTAEEFEALPEWDGWR